MHISFIDRPIQNRMNPTPYMCACYGEPTCPWYYGFVFELKSKLVFVWERFLSLWIDFILDLKKKNYFHFQNSTNNFNSILFSGRHSTCVPFTRRNSFIETFILKGTSPKEKKNVLQNFFIKSPPKMSEPPKLPCFVQRSISCENTKIEIMTNLLVSEWCSKLFFFWIQPKNITTQ